MAPPRSAVWRFALLALAWLVPCFALWYLLAPWQGRVLAWLAKFTLSFANEGVIRALEFEGSLARFVTNLEVRNAAQAGDVVFEVNPLLYAYGTAIVVALMAASRANWRKYLIGLAVLVPFQVWGIAFDVLAQAVRGGTSIASQAGLIGWKAEAAALGYQLGSLIFPAVVPIVTWAMLEQRFIAAAVLDRSDRSFRVT